MLNERQREYIGGLPGRQNEIPDWEKRGGKK
jgi:hypothetical protein